MKQILKCSDLRRHAEKEVSQHLDQRDPVARMADALLGTPVQKGWFDAARARYHKASGGRRSNRISTLASALLDIYKCTGTIKQGAYQDSGIHQWARKIETAYLNAVLDYIESQIHQQDMAVKHQRTLAQSIACIAEENQKLAGSYQTLLQRYISLNETRKTIENLLDLHPDDFDPFTAAKIKQIFTYHQDSLKQDPLLYDSLISQVKNKLETVYHYYNTMMGNEESRALPSAERMIEIVAQFEVVYRPLNELVHATRYDDFTFRKNEPESVLEFISEDYYQFKKMYDYLSYPRDSHDTRRLLALYQELTAFREALTRNWRELNDLKPGIDRIEERLESVLASHYQKDLLQYHKHFNDIINAVASEEKHREIIRFDSYLDQQLKFHEDSRFVLSRIAEMRKRLREMLDHELEMGLRAHLRESKSDAEITTAIDYAVNRYMELGDLDAVEQLQSAKGSMIRTLHKLRDLRKRLSQDSPHIIRGEKIVYPLSEPTLRLMREISEAMEKLPAWRTKELNRLVGEMQEILSRIKIPRSISHTALMGCTLEDRFNRRSYQIILKDRITIGRNPGNDLILPSKWVSGEHCNIDFESGVLTDLNSTNGTFVNHAQQPVTYIKIDQVETLNIAGEITLSHQRFDGGDIFLIEPNAQWDDQNRDPWQSLAKLILIHPNDGAAFGIDKLSGDVLPQSDPNRETIMFLRKGSQLYMTDPALNVHDTPFQDAVDKYQHHSQRFFLKYDEK